MLAFALRYHDRIYCRNLADGQQITFGSGKKDTIQLREMSEEQICVRAVGNRLTIQTRSPFVSRQDSISLGVVVRLDEASGTNCPRSPLFWTDHQRRDRSIIPAPSVSSRQNAEF